MRVQSQLISCMLQGNYLLKSGTLMCPIDYLDNDEIQETLTNINKQAIKIGEKCQTIQIPEEIIKMISLDIDIFDSRQGQGDCNFNAEFINFSFQSIEDPIVFVIIFYCENNDIGAAHCVAGFDDGNFFYSPGGDKMKNVAKSDIVSWIPQWLFKFNESKKYRILCLKKRKKKEKKKKRTPKKKKKKEGEDVINNNINTPKKRRITKKQDKEKQDNTSK